MMKQVKCNVAGSVWCGVAWCEGQWYDVVG